MLVSEPEAIAAYMQDAGADYGQVGLEAGPLSRLLHDALGEYGLPVVCLETRQLKATLAGARNQDRPQRRTWYRANGARGLSRSLALTAR